MLQQYAQVTRCRLARLAKSGLPGSTRPGRTAMVTLLPRGTLHGFDLDEALCL